MERYELLAPRRTLGLIAVFTLLFSGTAQGKDFVARKVTYSEAMAFLGDEQLRNQNAEIISNAGKVTRAKFDGFSNGAILLKGAPSVPLCEVNRVKVIRRSSTPFRRLVGMAGGVIVGTVVAAPFAVSTGSAGGAQAVLTSIVAFGAYAGYKAAGGRQSFLYLLDQASFALHCE